MHHLDMEIGFGAVQGSEKVAGWGQNFDKFGCFVFPVQHNGVSEQHLQFVASRKEQSSVCLVYRFFIVLLHHLASRLKPLLQAGNVADCVASVSAVDASAIKLNTFHMGCEIGNCFEGCATRGHAKQVFWVRKLNDDRCHQADNELHEA